MRHPNRPKRTPTRGGFTLVEILVVLAIIAVLVSLSTVAIMKTRTVQQTNNTNTLITKVDQALQHKWQAAVETARNETPCALAQQWSNGDQARAKVIHIKLCLIREFPVSFQEATNPAGGPGGLAPNPTYLRAFQNARPGARSWQDESAACLYMILKRQTRGVEFDPDTALSSQEVVDPVGDGIKEVVDAYPQRQTLNTQNAAQPLIFVRFPGFGQSAPLLSLPQFGGGARPFPPSFDPVDQEGTLVKDANWVNNFSAGFQQNVHPLVAGKTFTLIPVVMSSGSDSRTFSTDDIYNFQLSAR